MDKAGLIIGAVLSLIGMYKIDMFLLPTLDYFGKYVFFAAINIFVFWVVYVFYKKFSGILKIAMPVVFGFVIMMLGIKMI